MGNPADNSPDSEPVNSRATRLPFQQRGKRFRVRSSDIPPPHHRHTEPRKTRSTHHTPHPHPNPQTPRADHRPIRPARRRHRRLVAQQAPTYPAVRAGYHRADRIGLDTRRPLLNSRDLGGHALTWAAAERHVDLGPVRESRVPKVIAWYAAYQRRTTREIPLVLLTWRD